MTKTMWGAVSLACLAIAGSATVGPNFSSGAAMQSGVDADRDAIRAHIDRIFKAYIAKDRHEVQVTHDKEWRGFLTGSGTIIKGIQDYMRAADGSLKSTSGGMVTYDMQQFDVQFRGNDIAIVPYVAEVTARSEGVERKYKLRVLDVYERQGHEWMQIASNTAMHPHSVFEQASEAAPMGPSQRAELLEAREAVWRAWFGGDAARLRTLLPPETIALAAGPDGWTTRDAIIKSALDFANGGGRLLKLEFPRTEIQSYGATAILYTTYAFETDTKGTRGGEKGKAIEVFVRRASGWVNSGWQLMADRDAARGS